MSELVRVSHGLWRPADAVSDLAGRCAAVLDALPPDAVIAGRAAGELHGLWLPELGDRPIDTVLTRPEPPQNRAHSERDEVRTRRRRVRTDEICIVHGLPALTEARTWIDLAEELTLADLVACGDSVLRGAAHGVPLEEMVRRASGRRGVRRARTALELLDARSRSRPESHLRVALVSGGLPAPEVNVAIHGEDGEWLAEPDLHYKVPKIALEYQGKGHAEVERMRRDITRGIGVVSNRWLSVPFGPAEVFGRPWTLAPLMRGLIELRAPGWLREWRDTRRVARYIAPLVG